MPSEPKLSFFEPGPPCKPADVVKLEHLVGGKLPDDYKQYLLTQNGAQPFLPEKPDDPCIVKVQWREDQPAREGGVGRGVSSFLRLRHLHKDTPDLVDVFESFHDRIPAGTLPIVRGNGSSLFLLALRGDQPGMVLYWDGDYVPDQEEGEEATYENVGLVAASFTEFLDALLPEPDDWAQWERDNA